MSSLKTTIDKWAFASLWMRAVANAVGYTPNTAKPLAIAYVLTRKEPRKYQLQEGGLEFAGLSFIEPVEGVIEVANASLRPMDYDVRTLHHFPQHKPQHDDLFYIACEVAELYDSEDIDETDFAWRKFTRHFRSRAGVGELRGRIAESKARGLLEALRP